MMYWYGPGMSGWGYAWMSIGMLVFWALLIAGIALTIRFALADRPPATPSHMTPEAILTQRFARGEIDEQEYTARMTALRENSGKR